MEFLTERLRLREFLQSDAAALRQIHGDAENRRYESKALSTEESDQKLRLALADQRTQPQTHWRWAITLPPDDQLRGWIALTKVRAEVREYEIGWTLETRLWGQGYASEAARAVLAYAFQGLQAHRVIAYCHAENLRSMRVMERLGMRPEALLRESNTIGEEWIDERIYAILERDFFEPGI